MFYDNYAESQIETTVGKPVYDPVKDVYTVTVTSVSTIIPAQMEKAKADAQANLDALDAYNPDTAKKEYQGYVTDILTVTPPSK